jgi:hypothetical protein
MKIYPITQSEFNQIPTIRQIIIHEYARKFACLDLGETLECYGLSWCSESVHLSIEYSNNQKLLWIGIDRQLAAICLQSGRICVAMPLTTNLIEIKIIQEVTAVLTEQEIFLFNSNGSLRFNHGFPDLPSEIIITEDGLIIPLMDGDRFKLNPQTGEFQQLQDLLNYPGNRGNHGEIAHPKVNNSVSF